jgi:hypothetical protein
MILFAAFVALLGRDCAAGDYKNVRFGPYEDSAHEDAVIGNLAPPIEDFHGVKAPQIFLTGRRRAFSFSEDMAGVSTVSITGPYGVVYAQQFTPPVKSTGLAIYDLPAGAYYVRSYNSVGGLSENRIWVAEIEPELDLGRSYAAKGKKPNSIDVHLAVKGRASEGLREFELIQNGKLVGGVPQQGKEAAASFNTIVPASQELTQFILQLSDQRGNYRQLRFTLDGGKMMRYIKPGVPVSLTNRILKVETSRPWRTVPEAGKYRLMLGNGMDLTFKNVRKTGEISTTWTSARPPNGYIEALGASFILRDWNGLQFDSALLTIDYGDLKLSPSQVSALKVVRVDNPRDGIYIEMPVSNLTEKHKLTAELQGLGKYMLTAPQFDSVHVAGPGGAKEENPEIELLSGVEVKLSVFDMKSMEGGRVIRGLKERNKLPVGNVYQVSPGGRDLEPSGALKMRYLDKTVSALGIDENTLALYTVSFDGDIYQLPYLTRDKDGNLLTAMVPRTYQLFAVLGSSTQAENQPPLFYPDGIPPTSKIAFSGSREGEYISTKTFVVLTAEDAKVPSVLTSGLADIFYFVQSETGAQDNVQLSTYTQPFTMKEGPHTLSYLAQDKAGNYEFPVSLRLSADGTPPITAAAVKGGELVLTAFDPVSNGVSSKVRSVFYALDAIPAGSRAAAMYSKPVELPAGKHIVYFFSMDKVGNMETVKSLPVDVLPRTSKSK